MNAKWISITIAGMLLFAALGMGVGYYVSNGSPRSENPGIQGLLWPNPKTLHAFTTIDDNGGNFGLDQLLGKWSLLFFGYTHCPDVCPLTLAVLNHVLQQLTGKGGTGKVQVIFVSVDPARDTPQRLKKYVTYFNKNFIGLGGSETQVQSLTSQLGIVSRIGKKTASGDYTVQHTASVFLVDPWGRLVSIFSPPLKAGNIVARYRQIHDFIQDHPVS